MLLLLEGDTSIKYQKSRIAVAQAKEYGYFWNECAKLQIDENMKSFRRKAIPFVHVEYHLTYKYIERSLALNHDEELEIIVSILGAIDFGEYALVHPDVIKNMSSLGLGFGLEYFNLNMYQIYIYIIFLERKICYIIY